MKKFIATSCEFRLHEDDWFEGEGKLISAWDEDLGQADTIAELLQKISYLDKNFMKIECIQDEFACYDNELNRFDADLMVDIEDDGHDGVRIIKPTEEKWKQFENGKVKLYSLHICVHIMKIAELDIDDVWNEGWRG